MYSDSHLRSVRHLLKVGNLLDKYIENFLEYSDSGKHTNVTPPDTR